MTIWSHGREAGSRRRSRALWALLGVLPLLTLASQIAAKKAALGLVDIAFGRAWFVALAHAPWAQALLGLEVVSFAAWMVVLSEMKLSAAYPLSAVGYLLVVVTGWTYFGEPITLLQLVGGAAILGGVSLIGSSDEDEAATP